MTWNKDLTDFDLGVIGAAAATRRAAQLMWMRADEQKKMFIVDFLDTLTHLIAADMADPLDKKALPIVKMCIQRTLDAFEIEALTEGLKNGSKE